MEKANLPSNATIMIYDGPEIEGCPGGFDWKELDPKARGRYGEMLAAQMLKEKGYIILERNWTCPFGEADIIALDEGSLVFVEVKTRSSIKRGLPEESVTPKKRSRYERIACAFLERYDGPDGRVRFDVVGVMGLPGARAFIRHTANAFGHGD